mgnify:CR=1 FL=1
MSSETDAGKEERTISLRGWGIFLVALSSSLRLQMSFSNDNVNIGVNATNQLYDWLNKEK